MPLAPDQLPTTAMASTRRSLPRPAVCRFPGSRPLGTSAAARRCVLKHTSIRQEPFVYGFALRGHVALCAATASRRNSVSPTNGRVRACAEIATQRAWEVVSGYAPSGFYADLARAPVEALNKAVAVRRPARRRAQAHWGASTIACVAARPSHYPARPPRKRRLSGAV